MENLRRIEGEEMNIVQKDYPWPHGFSGRNSTDYIIIHHTAGPQMQDVDDIFQEHCNLGWNGIGYHRVIKGDGTTVQGRPDWAVGAHAQGLNYCSVGVSLEGNFEGVDIPTEAQIQALKDNIADLKGKYPNAKVIGHRDVAEIIDNPQVATACPGETLYEMLPKL